MSGPNSQSSRCGCEYGGPCTRTTVCSVTRVSDEMQEEIDRLTAELAEAKSNLELARASAEGAAAALRMCRENEEELIEELAEAKRVRAAAIYEASDARMERDALRVQVAGLKDAIHEALECALPPHAARELRAALAGPTRTAEQPEDALPDGRECGACGHWIEEGASEECSLSHTTDPTTAEGTENGWD